MTLEKKADKLQREYVILRDTNGEYGKCVTCRAVKPISDLDAGHYIHRGNKNTRYHEKNVHLQCRKCNRFESGNLDEYALYLQSRYGEGILKELSDLKWKSFIKYDSFYIMGVIEDYKLKINERNKM